MNGRREAMLWSVTIVAALLLGLAVVWVALAMSYGRPNLVPLSFAAAPYRQDDYSADDARAPRLNPLDPGLVQEVAFEDRARGNPISEFSYSSQGGDQTGPTVTAPASVNTLRPAPTSTPQPLPTNTQLPAPTSTPQSLPTNTQLPTVTQTPIPAVTSVPSVSKPGKNTPKPPKPPNTPKPPKTPPPPVNTPRPRHHPHHHP